MKLALRTLAVIGFAGVSSAWAQVSLTGLTYTQDFNNLPNTGSAVTWTNNSTLAGWSAIAPLLTPTTITPQTGSGTTGLLASFGANANTDRALGWVYANAIGAAASQASFGVGLTNNGAATFDSFSLSYEGTQWRTNTATPGTLTVEYKIGGTFDNSNTGWTSIPSLTFTGPNVTGAAAVDGYLPANSATLSTAAPISIGLSAGQTLWIRWRDTNDAGTDAQLAIDNLSFTAIAIPEPSTYAAALGVMVLAGVVIKRRR